MAKRHFILHIAVEVEPDVWDSGCDETHDLMRLANRLTGQTLVYTNGEKSSSINRAFLDRGYESISEERFLELEAQSMDKKGV